MVTQFPPAHCFATLSFGPILSAFFETGPGLTVHSFLSGWATSSLL